MRRAIASVSMSGTLREKLEAAAAARFDAVELSESDFIAFRGTAREVRRIADDLGIAIDLYSPSLDFEAVPAAQLLRNLERAERKFDLLESLGVPTLGLTANSSDAALPDPALASEHLHTLAERAARRNVRVAFGASPTARWVRTYQDAWSILQRVAHPHLGLRLDSFDTLLSGAPDLDGLGSIPGNQIFFVGIADGQRARGDAAESSWHRTFPAQGELDVVSFLERVLIGGYAGTVCLQSVNDFSVRSRIAERPPTRCGRCSFSRAWSETVWRPRLATCRPGSCRDVCCTRCHCSIRPSRRRCMASASWSSEWTRILRSGWGRLFTSSDSSDSVGTVQKTSRSTAKGTFI